MKIVLLRNCVQGQCPGRGVWGTKSPEAETF